MKTTHIYKYMLAAIVALAAITSCTRFEEQEIPDVAPKVQMTFTADIEGDTDTKTVLGGQMGDAYRKLLWEPQDSIGVTASLSNGLMDKFVNIEEQITGVGTFQGSTSEGSTYYMFYPYRSGLSANDGSNITFSLPTSQKYRKESFASDAMPMVSKASAGESHRFYSLCGVFAVNLTGSETVKSIAFAGKDASGNALPVSGGYSVNMNYEEYPQITPVSNLSTSVSLNCGDGVVLDPATPTPFYLVLPVAKYESFTIIISTTDGKVMMKEVNKTLEIKRAVVTKTASLAYVASETINLSETGWSNCYVVSEPGLYSFDATVIGNGEYGMIPNAGFHTTSPSIEPASAALVWEDRTGVIAAPVFDGSRINFMTTGVEGNALIAAKDADGTILWSWHIWATDDPVEQTYVNSLGTFKVLDRNLGATSADRGTGDEWFDSRGLSYFWGRKDPFSPGAYEQIEGTLTLEESIAKPTTRHKLSTWYGNQTSWMGENAHIPYLWSENQKTIYDPCPVGYRVAVSDIWGGFTATGSSSTTSSEFNVSGIFDKGWNFYIDDSKSLTAWYPASYYFGCSSGYRDYHDKGLVWASDYTSGSNKNCFYYESGDIRLTANQEKDGTAIPVRCMKDEGHVDISLPSVTLTAFKDITETSVKVVADVKRAGASEVTERGFIWGTTEDLSDGIKVSAGSGIGEFSCELNGLSSATIYYVKAYAVNGKGESQTPVRTFSTRYSDSDAVDLSKFSTSNCYIVSSPGLYVFNCLVKGNSAESVGTPTSASVVWETKNTDESVSTGDIITSVELRGGYLSFEVPTPFTPGNALVAVKDASGTILWSWHIWVTDFDPDITVQTYISGAKMMDRNLGALDAGKTSSAYGFLYQWGRKDPLITSATGGSDFAVTAPADVRTFVESVTGDMLEYTIQNPTHTVHSLYLPDDSWNNNKSMYDPCPEGWRVPDGGPDGVWAGILWEGISKDRESGSVYWTIGEQYSTPPAVYPAPGYTGGDSIDISFPGSALYCWSCTSISDSRAYGMHLFDRIERELTTHRDDEYSVRCQMMESDYTVETIDLVSEAQSSVTVKAKVSVVRDCTIEEKGIVYSTTDPLPTIDDNEGKIKSDSTDVGEFECTVTGIRRQAKYYIRPYVLGEKGVKYGKVVEYIERTPGSGEGFTGDDFEW